MFTRSRHESGRGPSRPAVQRTSILLASAFLLAAVPRLFAQDTPLPPIKFGAGLQTSFLRNMPDEGRQTDRFLMPSARIYVDGPIRKDIKFMFNTEYNSGTQNFQVLDVVGRFEPSPKFNLWVGRMLAPSDRANLYGPYYAHHWNTFVDGVQDGYPFVVAGRTNGALYWGQFGKVKVSGGAFDGLSTDGDDTVIGAGRVQVDFWDPENGYYLNGTYYGDKNLLAIGLAGQNQGSDRNAYSVDFLLERNLRGAGAVSVEAEWAKYDHLGGYSARYGVNDGWYLLGAYIFPKTVGIGKFEVLGKFGEARFREGITLPDADFDQKTAEFNLNYLIKQFDARIMFFVLDTRFNAVRVNNQQIGVGFQFQM